MAFNTGSSGGGGGGGGVGTGRGGSPASFGASASPSERAGWGSQQSDSNVEGGTPKIHSAHGFRRALEKTQKSGRLVGQMTDKSFGGSGYNKPNYFAQGGKRHGMHIGSGAPFTGPGQQEGADV